MSTQRHGHKLRRHLIAPINSIHQRNPFPTVKDVASAGKRVAALMLEDCQRKKIEMANKESKDIKSHHSNKSTIHYDDRDMNYSYSSFELFLRDQESYFARQPIQYDTLSPNL